MGANTSRLAGFKDIERVDENTNKVTECGRMMRFSVRDVKIYYTHATTNEFLSHYEEDAKRKAYEISRLRNEELQNAKKATQCFEDGQRLWEAAWQAERNDDCNAATNKFEQALSQFQQAAKCRPDNQIYCKYMKLAQYKLEGNSAFNEGLSLQDEGNRLQELKKFVEAAGKYVEALGKFKQAGALLHEVTEQVEAQRFRDCAEFVRETLNDLEALIGFLKESERMSVLSGLSQLMPESATVERHVATLHIDFQYLRDTLST